MLEIETEGEYKTLLAALLPCRLPAGKVQS